MKPRIWITQVLILAVCMSTGCGRDSVAFQSAVYRIERGTYSAVVLYPQWLELHTADGTTERSYWPGAQMRPQLKSDVTQAVMRAKANGHAVEYRGSHDRDDRTAPAAASSPQ